MELCGNTVAAKFANGEYRLSFHCHDRMDERGISEDDIVNACTTGKPIELQNHGRDDKVLMEGTTCCGKTFYAVVAVCQPSVHVVTVCWFKDSIWADVPGLRKRKM